MEIAAAPSILGLLVLSLPLIVRLIVDYIKIEKKKEPITKSDYRVRWGVTFLATIGAGVISKLLDPTAPLVFHILFSAGVFVLFFDYALNLLRGKKWYYRSSNPQHPSKWEQIRMNYIPIHADVFLRLIVTGAMISTYFYYTYL